MRRLFGALVGVLGVGTVYVLAFGLFVGWAYWVWISFYLGSFWMFVFGLLGPFAFIASVLGLWSFLFSVPLWLINLVT